MTPDGHLWASLSLALIPIGFAFAIQWLTQRSPLAGRLQEHKGLVGPFFTSIALLFALFAVFVTQDVWVRAQDHREDLERSLEREASAVRVIDQVAGAIGDVGDGIRARLKDYVEAARGEEAAAADGGRTGAVNSALQGLVDEILKPATPAGGIAIAREQMLDGYVELQRARAERAPLLPFSRDPYKWTGMIILGVLTQAAIAMCQIEVRKAEAAALALFTTAFVVVVVVLALAEHDVANLAVGTPAAIRHSLE